MQYLAVLGRQPRISAAELEAQFTEVKLISSQLATFAMSRRPDINRLGGQLKLAEKLPARPVDYLLKLPQGKITLGISDYSAHASAKSAAREALKLKQICKRQGRSVRTLPNTAAAISTAAAHHNQLGEKPGHVELIKTNHGWWASLGTQNITAYTKRDQARPARDAKVGMLPPKLAQILINLCGPLPEGATVLDPFCGTGVLLQEAYLMGYHPYGTDVDARMVEYTCTNLCYIQKYMHNRLHPSAIDAPILAQGDATNYTWQQPIDAVAAEIYLGPPMSLPPAEVKLKEAKQVCGGILLKFLQNIAPQLKSGTPLALGVPAWLRSDGSYSRLNLLDEITNLGYNVYKYHNASQADLLYVRTGQVVAREIIVLRKR